MNITWPANRFVPLSKLVAAFCVLLIPWTPLHRAEGSDQAECDPPGNVGLDFVVTAPEKKPNGESWDKGQSRELKETNPDIFVCYRATLQQWNCAPPCEDSIVCKGTLRVVPSCGKLEIAVFDNDDEDKQKPEVIYESKAMKTISNARRCKRKSNPCEVLDGKVTFAVLEPSIEYWGDPNGSQFSVIWLGGSSIIGDDPLGPVLNRWKPVIKELNLPRGINVRFVFPHAPMQPRTMDGGEVARAWYDVICCKPKKDPEFPHEVYFPREIDNASLKLSADWVEALIQAEIERGIPSDRILLVGHSQGGRIALYTGLKFDQRLMGIAGLSAYLPRKDVYAGASANRYTYIFMGHGEGDLSVPFDDAKKTERWLLKRGYKVEWRDFDGGHMPNAKLIDDLSIWIFGLLRDATR